jgi:hypothetical protein
MRVAGIVSLIAILGACAASAQPQTNAGAAPDWMSGYWLSCEDGETAENWIGGGRGVLLGTNLSGGGFEFLRIADNGRGGLSYFSMPNGRAPATEFAMAAHADQRVVFENPAHDFPQRIIYERDGDVMVARIEGPMNGREEAIEWRFRRAAPNARCPG